jgi:hypothetical protein
MPRPVLLFLKSLGLEGRFDRILVVVAGLS